MVLASNGNSVVTKKVAKSEYDLRVELAAAYNILDYLNLGEGNHTPALP